MSEQEQPGPPWSEAPEWANWKAMDGDGYWYWFQSEPLWEDADDGYWYVNDDANTPEMADVEFSPDCSGIDWNFASSEKYQRPS